MSATTKEKDLGTEAVRSLPGCCREGLARVGESAVTTPLLPRLTCLFARPLTPQLGRNQEKNYKKELQS